MKVKLRKRQIRNKRVSLRLDYSPPLINPQTGKKSRFETLHLYLYQKPGTPTEKQHNKETEQLAENIRARRQLDLQIQLHGSVE